MTREVEPIAHFSGPGAMRDTISQFFGRKFSFVETESIEWVKYKIDPKRVIVSWNVYAQALFIGADDYSELLFPTRDRKWSPHHHKTTSLYLGLDLVKAISKVETRREELLRDREFEKKRIAQTSAGVPRQIEAIEAKLRQVEKRLQDIEEGVSALVDPMHVREVDQQVSGYTAKIVKLGNKRSEKVQALSQLDYELQRQNRIVHELREAITFKVFLSGLRVEICPQCESQITHPAQVEDEIASGHCHLCHNPLKSTMETDQQEVLLAASQTQVDRLKKARRKIRKEIKSLGEQVVANEAELEKCRTEFEDLARQQQEGLTSELRNLLYQRGNLQGQLDHLYLQTEEKLSEHLKQIEIQVDILKEVLRHLQSRMKYNHAETLEKLSRYTTELAKSFGVPHLKKIAFTDGLQMRIEQSDKTVAYSRMEQGEKLRLKIAFHLALLLLRVEEGIGRHPRLLIIDAPGGAEMDDSYFNAVTEYFTEIEQRLGNEAQILIATSKEELLDMFAGDKIEHKEKREFLF
jgi:hypothetical protein